MQIGWHRETTVLERSIALTDQINLTATRLGDIRNSIADGGPSPASSGLVADTVDEINALANPHRRFKR